MAKTDFDHSVSILDSKIAANEAKNEFTENELKKLKTFIRVILLAKVILKKMVHKII